MGPHRGQVQEKGSQMDGKVGREGSWSVQGHPDKFHFVEDGTEIEQSDG